MFLYQEVGRGLACSAIDARLVDLKGLLTIISSKNVFECFTSLAQFVITVWNAALERTKFNLRKNTIGCRFSGNHRVLSLRWSLLERYTYWPSPSPSLPLHRSPSPGAGVSFYRFDDPALPAFELPPANTALNTSPGDIQLNWDNPIVSIDGSDVPWGCNGDIVSSNNINRIMRTSP